MKLLFTFKVETKGAFRYQEVDESGKVLKGDADGATVGTLYLRKKALSGKAPSVLAVEIFQEEP
jgi:hypothetical protein